VVLLVGDESGTRDRIGSWQETAQGWLVMRLRDRSYCMDDRVGLPWSVVTVPEKARTCSFEFVVHMRCTAVPC